MVGLGQCEAEPTDDQLLDDIEEAARESRRLADDLANMLASLETLEAQGEAVEAAVRGDEEQLDIALADMLEKVQELATASLETDSAKLSSVVNRERADENELQRAIEEIEKVTQQIQGVVLREGCLLYTSPSPRDS